MDAAWVDTSDDFPRLLCGSDYIGHPTWSQPREGACRVVAKCEICWGETIFEIEAYKGYLLFNSSKGAMGNPDAPP